VCIVDQDLDEDVSCQVFRELLQQGIREADKEGEEIYIELPMTEVRRYQNVSKQSRGMWMFCILHAHRYSMNSISGLWVFPMKAGSDHAL